MSNLTSPHGSIVKIVFLGVPTIVISVVVDLVHEGMRDQVKDGVA